MGRCAVSLPADRRAGADNSGCRRVFAGPLFAWFTERGYTFIPHFYGNPNNNYMGARPLTLRSAVRRR